MMRQRNISRRLRATLIIALALPIGSAALPQTPALPDPNHVAGAYFTLRQWADAFELPRPADDAAKFTIDGASGACVIVRRSGRTLGIGADVGGDALMLRRATADALGEALSDASVSALPDDVRNTIGRSLTVELEVAGTMTPLIGRDAAQMAVRVEPGVEGLAIRRGQSLVALFPSQMRATNTADDPAARIVSLAVQAGIDAADLSNIPRLTDVTIYSFRTVHLIQPAPNRSPIQTFRGDVIVSQSAIDHQALIDLADGLASHLMASVFPEPAPPPPELENPTPLVRSPLGLMGTYRPFADVYEPLIAPPLDQALGALALSSYAHCTAIDKAKAEAAGRASMAILRDLAEVASGEAPPTDDPVAAAAIVWAITETPSVMAEAAIRGLFDDASARVVSSFDVDSGFAIPSGPNTEGRGVSPHGQALIAAAMCRLLMMKANRPSTAANLDAGIVRAALERAWTSVAVHERVALLPWIGWAEMDFARATGQAPAHVDDLRQMREAIERSRIDAGMNVPPDLIGGFDLSSTHDRSGRRTANAQSVRPAAWLATLIRDDRFTPPKQQPAALQRHMQTMRFIIQLTAREAMLATCRNPDRARGGIRAAPWDATQPMPAQALALLTAVRTVDATGH
jgi:hypothetical protein